MQRSNPRRHGPDRLHEVFAVMNSLHNPWLAEIYLSLVASYGSSEEIAQARRRIAETTDRRTGNETDPNTSSGRG